jgi:hypothetical protein
MIATRGMDLRRSLSPVPSTVWRFPRHVCPTPGIRRHARFFESLIRREGGLHAGIAVAIGVSARVSSEPGALPVVAYPCGQHSTFQTRFCASERPAVIALGPGIFRLELA